MDQASKNEDGRRQTKVQAPTVHLMDRFGRWTKIIILRLMSGRIFDDGLSIYGRIRTTYAENFYLMDRGGRFNGRTDRCTS